MSLIKTLYSLLSIIGQESFPVCNNAMLTHPLEQEVLIWASTGQNPVFGVSHKVRLKPVSSATETS